MKRQMMVACVAVLAYGWRLGNRPGSVATQIALKQARDQLANSNARLQQEVERVIQATAANYSSMYQDVSQGRRTSLAVPEAAVQYEGESAYVFRLAQGEGGFTTAPRPRPIVGARTTTGGNP